MTTKKRVAMPEGDARFLWLAYCGLVLRGYGNPREIADPILKEVWRRGKRIAEGLKR